MAQKIEVQLILDSNVAEEMARARRVTDLESKKMSGALNKLSSTVKGLVAAYVGFRGIQASIGFMARAALAAGDLDEALSKQRTVFRGLEIEVAGFNKTLQEEFALSRVESARFTSTIQDTLVPLGIARDRAGQMSFEVVKLARDLASFNNLPTEQVVTDIQSALVGNVETLRKYGVALNQATIEQKALEDGLIANKNELTPTTKALAILSLTMEGSSDAIGDFARTSESFNNQLVALNSRWGDFNAQLGTFITNSPVIQGALKSINEGLQFMTDFLTDDALQEALNFKSVEEATDIIDDLSEKWQAVNDQVVAQQEAVKTTAKLIDGEVVKQIDLKKLVLEREGIEKRLQAVMLKRGDIISGQVKAEEERDQKTKETTLTAEAAREKEVLFQQEVNDKLAVLREENTENFLQGLFDEEEKAAKLKDAAAAKDKARAKKAAREEAALKRQSLSQTADLIAIAGQFQGESSKKSFKITQALSLAEATIRGIAAVQFALGNPPGFPLNAPTVALTAAIAAANVARIATAKAPAFQGGGIVEGNQTSGDRVAARVNSGEMILNRTQQSNLFNAISGGITGTNVNIGGDTIVINGNADEAALASIAATREQQLQDLRESIIDLQSAGQFPQAA